MSFPEAVKQVLFGGVVPSGLARAPLPSHRRVLPNGSVSFLTLIFFLFVPFIASRKLFEVWRSVSVSPFCARSFFFDLLRRASHWRAFDLSPCLGSVRRRGRRVYRRGSDWLPGGDRAARRAQV